MIKVARKVDTAVRVSDMAKLSPLIYAIRLDANPQAVAEPKSITGIIEFDKLNQ